MARKPTQPPAPQWYRMVVSALEQLDGATEILDDLETVYRCSEIKPQTLTVYQQDLLRRAYVGTQEALQRIGDCLAAAQEVAHGQAA